MRPDQALPWSQESKQQDDPDHRYQDQHPPLFLPAPQCQGQSEI